MRSLSKLLSLLLLASFFLGSPLSSHSAKAQKAVETILIPIGGGYSDVYAGYMATVVNRAVAGKVKILVLPATYSTNPVSITDAERQVNIRDAEARRYEIQEACKRAAPADVTCTAVLIPVFTREDADNPDNIKEFTPDLTAVFILGGDQTVAMRALIGTRVEQALTEAYQSGVIVGGTSAGCGMLAVQMLAGYRANFAAENSLDFGSADMWTTSELRGLPFGIPNAILDQHFYQRARLTRLVNAILLPEVPHVGIGVDAYTGVNIYNQSTLRDVFGLYTVTILDAQTYHTADSAKYNGEHYTISARNLLIHLLAPGAFQYDLNTRKHSLAAPQPKVVRNFDFLKAPAGAGTLILGGDLSGTLKDSPVLARFKELAANRPGKVLVIAVGYPTERSAQTIADNYNSALGIPTVATLLPAGKSAPVVIPADTSAILVVSKDQSKLVAADLAAVRTAWLSGTPVLLDNAAAPLAGKFYSAHPPTPNDAEETEKAVQRSFLKGRTKILDGLGFLNTMFEPQLIGDNRWGRLFSLAYNHPQLPVFGINQDTAMEIGSDGAVVIGSGVVISLDLRLAKLALGTNEGFVIANGLLDIFTPADAVAPETADTQPAYTPQPTPDIRTFLATATPQATSTLQPTTPLPTFTAAPVQETPQPSTSQEDGTLNNSIILGGGAAAIVLIILAVVLTRTRKK